MFFEFQAPSITPAVAEGGSEVFKVDYFDTKMDEKYKKKLKFFESLYTKDK